MQDRKDIEELIKMLDKSMASGVNHVNVKVNGDGHVDLEEVSVETGADCSSGDVACKIPNLRMDDDDLY